MRMCPSHWQACRDAVEHRGMSALIARDGQEAVERLAGELQGLDHKATFDPLMALNNHFAGEALRCGGLYVMGKNETGENDGHYCPICEFEKHAKGFDAIQAIGGIADQMLTWARKEGLLPPPS